MKIDCEQCAMYRSDHCDDCLVTAVLHPPAGALDLEEELEPSLHALSSAGLIPVLKFRPRDGGSGARTPETDAADTG